LKNFPHNQTQTAKKQVVISTHNQLLQITIALYFPTKNIKMPLEFAEVMLNYFPPI